MAEKTGITPLRCDGHSHIFANCATRCQCGERTHPATENGAAPMMVVGQVTLTPPPYTLEPVMVPRHIVMEFCRLGCQIAGAQDGDPLDWPKLIAAIDRLRHSAPISPPSPAEAPEATLPEREPEPFSELQRAGFAAIRSGAANRAPASETQTATPEPSVAWLIERGTGTSGVHWFCGQGGDVAHDWTSNANNALKFPNRESAQREIDERSGVTGIHSPLGVATEHVFLTQHEFGSPRAAQPATTALTDCGTCGKARVAGCRNGSVWLTTSSIHACPNFVSAMNCASTPSPTTPEAPEPR